MKETINFKENQEKIRERYQAKKIALKKQERKEWILFIFIATFILITSMTLLYKLNTENLNRCMSKGYSEQTCLRNI